jgi:UDP-GlcNAc:undecaprenyl-phosphate GlcNAc-1-phosphate transferase
VSETLLPVFTPLFILAIPLFDTLAVVAIRICKGKPIYIGDHNHISHRFAAMGITRKQAVFLIHLLSLIIGLSVLPVMWGDARTVIVCGMQAFVLLVFVSVLQYSLVKMEDKK